MIVQVLQQENKMSEMIDMTINAKEFEAKFAKLVKKAAPESFPLAVRNALYQLRIDAGHESPTVPKGKTGNLRSETEVIVKQIPGGGAKGELQYKMPYAAYQHRAERADGTHKIENYSEPGSGKDYLQSKLIGNQEKHLEIMAKTISKKTGIN